MSAETRRSLSGHSRRAALGGIGAVAAAMGFGRVDHAIAQESTLESLANHPLAGTWAVMTTGGVVPQTHHADGSLIAAFPPNYVDPASGLTFQGAALGQWESTGDRTGRFTFFQALSDSAGAYAGTFQLADELEVSTDGQSWSGSHEAHIIMRDATNAVLMDEAIPFGTPVTATRIGATIGSVVLPEVRPQEATPTS